MKNTKQPTVLYECEKCGDMVEKPVTMILATSPDGDDLDEVCCDRCAVKYYR